MALSNTAISNGAAFPLIPPTGGTGGPAVEYFALLNLASFTCNGATPVTVADTGVTANSTIIPTLKTVGGTVGALPVIQTITAGTGYTIQGTASDTSVYTLLRIG